MIFSTCWAERSASPPRIAQFLLATSDGSSPISVCPIGWHSRKPFSKRNGTSVKPTFSFRTRVRVPALQLLEGI